MMIWPSPYIEGVDNLSSAGLTTLSTIKIKTDQPRPLRTLAHELAHRWVRGWWIFPSKARHRFTEIVAFAVGAEAGWRFYGIDPDDRIEEVARLAPKAFRQFAKDRPEDIARMIRKKEWLGRLLFNLWSDDIRELGKRL